MPPTLPFAVHRSWRSEFARRWRVARPLLLVAFVLVQAVVIAAMAVALAVADAPVTGFAVLLVLPPACYLAWFVLARRWPRSPSRAARWRHTGPGGCCSPRRVRPRGHQPAPAVGPADAPTAPVRQRDRRRAPLRPHLKPHGLYGLPAALVRGSVPLAEIAGVRLVDVGGAGTPLLAEGVAVPPGPAVAVSTVRGEVVNGQGG